MAIANGKKVKQNPSDNCVMSLISLQKKTNEETLSYDLKI